MAPKRSQAEVILYSDGACSGNPGPGGWAFVLIHPQKRLEESGAELHTTNNRMELLGVIKGLQKLNRPTKVHVITDSAYLKNGITTWIHNWKKNGWMRKERNKKVPVKNDDLWKLLDHLVHEVHDVTFEWTKGHAGNPENERCDELAVDAYKALLASQR